MPDLLINDHEDENATKADIDNLFDDNETNDKDNIVNRQSSPKQH